MVARQLALRHRLTGLDEPAQQMVAAALFLRRQEVSPERIAEVLPATFTPEERRQALTVAAMVRMAASLDRSGAVTIERISETDGAVRVLLDGQGSDEAARRASRRSDLWAMLYATRLEWGLLSADGDVVVAVPEGQKLLGINGWDAMPTAARKVLSYWYRQMRSHEAGTRLGEDPEELHDMRTATRRMRSALGLFGSYLPIAEATRANERLRRLASVLGAVRDLDVAIANAERYASGFPEAERPDLTPLLSHWARMRDQARRTMERYLQGREYARLQQSMGALLTRLESEPSWAEGNAAIGALAPRLLYVYDAVVEAYDEVLRDAPVQLLHALRIDCKRLRYGLEFFREVLPAEIEALIPDVVRLQDHLGDLHDQFVAVEMITATLAQAHNPNAAGVLAYREACATRQHELERGFREVWRAFAAQKAPRLLKKQIGAQAHAGS